MLERLKIWARKLKTEIYALYIAYQDPRTPLIARIFSICIVGYAFSPIDLIPDFIPVLGFLDDAILLPLGIWLVVKIIPPQVLAESREKARLAQSQDKPQNWIAAGFIILIWLSLAVLAGVYFWRIFQA
ncbi:MAG: YkvA family protein [Acidobacteriota bacterium]